MTNRYNQVLDLFWPSLLSGLLFALISNYLLYLFFFKSSIAKKWFSKRKLYNHIHSKEEILYEIKHAIIPEIYLSFVTCLALSSKPTSPIKHFFKIRWGFNTDELQRIFFEIFCIFVIYEIYYYFVHVIMHKRKFYKITHSVHHKSIYPTPQTGTSVNLLEAVIFYAFFTLMIFGPFHIASLILISLEIKFASLTQHMGHEIFPVWVRRSPILKYFNSIKFHQLHHSDKQNMNFGYQTSFLDRFFKTINPAYLNYEKNN
jgi:sterol desaturase/sphingolipid hydroxylase (fatty acid hydroxylase superfamily)